MDTQEREKLIYDFFEQKALYEGITTADFRKYLENPEVNTDNRGHKIITQPDYRFRKIVSEFSDILTKTPDGRMIRYCLEEDSYRESLYHRHIGFKTYISNCLGKKVFNISYQKYNSTDSNTIVFHPEYKRIYNGILYIYGIAFDTNEQKFDIVNDCPDNNLLFTQLNVNLITRIKTLDDKNFIKTFGSPKEWDTHFEFVLGVDPIPNREPVELILYVKNEFKDRFYHLQLARFIISETKSDISGYTLITLKIKHNRELERVLLSYGNDILIKSPDKIRKIVANAIKKLNNYYNN